MADDKKPDDKDALISIVWLLVGLSPIPIWLGLFSSNGNHPSWINPAYIFLLSLLLNLLGGLGCMRLKKDAGLRITLGFLLAFFFFLLSTVVLVFQACSHMNF